MPFFITTARGFIHDERALYDALKEKRIAGAGLDVWDKEPPPPDHPLLQFDNVLASPHTAGVTKEARINMGRIAAEQMLDALDGKRPPRIINPEVWPAYAKRLRTTFGVHAEIGLEAAKPAEKILPPGPQGGKNPTAGHPSGDAGIAIFADISTT